MVRFIIVWSLHNRLLVIAGVLAPDRGRHPLGPRAERRGLSRPDPAAGRGHHAEPRLQPRGDGAAGRHPDRDGPERDAGPGGPPEHLGRRPERHQVPVRLRDRLLVGPPGGHQPDRLRRQPARRACTPGLSPWSPTGEIVRYVLEGPGYTTNQLKAVQDWVLQRTLKTVPGVIDVTGYGGTVKQYQVLVDTRLLRQYNVTLKQVEDAIDNSNANVGGDILTLGSQAHNVRATRPARRGRSTRSTRPTSTQADQIVAEKIDDINNVVVASTNGIPIYVKQVAQVVEQHRPRLGIVGRRLKEKDGKPRRRSTRTTSSRASS